MVTLTEFLAANTGASQTSPRTPQKPQETEQEAQRPATSTTSPRMKLSEFLSANNVPPAPVEQPNIVQRGINALANAPFQTAAAVLDTPANLAMLAALGQGVHKTATQEDVDVPPVIQDAPLWARAGYNTVYNDEGEERGAMKASDWLRDASTFMARSIAKSPLFGGIGLLADPETLTRDMAAEKGEPGYQSAMDDAIGTVGSALIPLPTGGKVNLTAKAIEAVPSLAGISKPLRLLERGMELGTPLSLPNTPGNMAANVAVDLGLDTAIRTATDNDTVFEEITSALDMEREDKAAVYDAGLRNSGIPGYNAETVQRSGTDTGGTAYEGNENDDGATTFGDAALAGGTTAAVGGGAAFGLAALGGALSGKPKALRGMVTDLEAGVFDADRRLIEEVRGEHGDRAAETLETTLRVNTRNALHNRTNNAINRGELTSDGSIVMPPIRLMEDVHKALTPDQQKLFADAANAGHVMDMIDQIRAQGTSAKQVINAPGKVYQALGGRIGRAKKDPKVAALLKMYKEGTDQMLTYSDQAAGILDTAAATDLRKSRFYVPRVTDRAELSIGEQFRDAFDQMVRSTAAKNIHEYKSPYLRGREEGLANINDVINTVLYNKEVNNPIAKFKDYVKTTMQHGGENIARREVIDAILRGRDSTSTVARVKDPGKAHGQVMPIWRNGKVEYYSIGDPGLFKSLQYNPNKALPLLTSAKQLGQMSMTGVLEPLFVVKSLIYDAGFGIATQRTKNGVSGPLDAWLDTKLQGRVDKGLLSQKMAEGIRSAVAGPIRITELPLVVARGMAERALGGWREEGVRLAQKRLASAIGDAALTKEATKGLDDAMALFLDTKYSMLSRQGYTSQSIQDDFDAITLLERPLQKVANTMVGRIYRHTLDMVREGYRMGLATQQISHLERLNAMRGYNIGVTDRQLAIIAKNVRESASDPTRSGSNDIVQLLQSGVPYGGTVLQSMLHLIKSLNNPAFYSVVGSVLTLRMAHQAMMDGAMPIEERAKLREQTSKYRQSSHMPMLSVDGMTKAYNGEAVTADDVVWMPLGPELGALTYATEAAYRGVLGLRTEFEAPMGETIRETLLGLANITTNPALNIGLTAVGMDPIELHMQEGALEFTRDPISGGHMTSDLGGDTRGLGLNSGVMTDRVANFLDATLNAMGSTIADIIETTIDAPTAHDDTFFDSMGKAMGIVKYNHVDKFMPKDIPFFNSTQRDSAGTPLSDKFYDAERFFEALNAEDVIGDIGTTGNISDPVFRGPMMPTNVKGTPIEGQVQAVANFFDSPYRKRATRELSRIRRRMRTYTNDPDMPPDLRAQVFNKYNDDVQDEYRRMLDGWAAFEGEMKQQYGEDWSLRKLTREVRKVNVGAD